MAAGATYTPIATTTLTGSAANIDFTSISGSYTDLRIVILPKVTTGSTNVTKLRVNNDSGSNYSATYLYGNGTSAASARYSSVTLIDLGYGLYTPATAGTAMHIIDFLNYSNSTTYKTILSRNSDASQEASAQVGLWRSTAAITQITIACGGSFPTQNFLAGTTATLYGIVAA